MWLAVGTLIVLGGAGMALIPWSRDTSITVFFAGDTAWYHQLLIGAVFGFITARAGWGIVELPFMTETRIFFVDIIKPLRLSWPEILFVSVCAGIGEEILFRGAAQPFLGIWTTAIIFVLLHGYLNPFNISMSIYGIYMTVVIGVIGYLTEYFGIFTAIVAHTVIDVYLLYELSDAELQSDYLQDKDEINDPE